MSDERDAADFIKSLFRVSGLDEPDLEEGEDWTEYSSGRKMVTVIYAAQPSANAQTGDEGDVLFLSDEDKDGQKDVNEEGCGGDLSQEYYSHDEELFALADGGSSKADSKEVEAAQEEEKKPTFQSWCIIA